MEIPSHIFKAYDIRGLVEGELSEDLAYRLGLAFVSFLRKGQHLAPGTFIVVGRDMRPSSPLFQQEVIRGIRDAGADVVDIGMASTPLFNFACAHYPEHAGGIMVTASHNPAAYNGFKMTLGNGLPIGKNNGMDDIRDLVLHPQKTEAAEGAIQTKEVLPEYLAYLFGLVPKEHITPLTVVIDCGNGMADVTFPKLLQPLPITVTYLYREPDGKFPNHEANPLNVETLKELQKEVVARKADFGFALDGDADRIGVVDEQGHVVDASYVGTLIGLEVLKKYPGSHLLYDLRSSNIVRESWEAAGATTEMSVVGHAMIKLAMKKTNAAFANELSLHLYYRDMYGVESSDLSLLYILQLLSREKKSLSSLTAPLKKYVHSGEINFEVEDKDAAIERIEKRFGEQAVSVTRIDGIRMDFAGWWFSVRKSNTEPFLRLIVEANTKELLEEKREELTNRIQAA